MGLGDPVVLLHGIASSSEPTFANLLPLIEAGREVVAIDLLGFGGSPAPLDSRYDTDAHVASVVRTIRRLRLRGRFTLVGHSMGALFAARIAARHGRRLARAVLVSPPIYLDPDAFSGPERGVLDAYQRAYGYIREHPDFTLSNAAIVERFLPTARGMHLDERSWIPFTRSLENAIESQTALTDLAAATVPVEVVIGSLDEFSARGVLAIVERMRGVEVRVVRGSHHVIDRRLAAAVADAIGTPSGG